MNEIPEIDVESLNSQLGSQKYLLVDVRRDEEFNGELGHIPGSKLVTLGPALIEFLEATDKNKNIVFICRSGARSGQATSIALQMGFINVANMTGGMIKWRQTGY